jgi:DNA-binding transcriptional ArsR family regulator
MTSAKVQALHLRNQGYSYTDIAKKTGLSKSTISYHLANVPYTPNQEVRERVGRARVRAYQTKHRQKMDSFTQAHLVATSRVGVLTERDILMVGIGLYAGEGSKADGIVRLVNTDERIVRFFIRWLQGMGLSRNNMMVRVHAYPETDIRKAERHWLSVLKIPPCNLQKSYIDTRKNKAARKTGIHEHGTAHVTVKAGGDKRFGVALSRQIGAYLELVLE